MKQRDKYTFIASDAAVSTNRLRQLRTSAPYFNWLWNCSCALFRHSSYRLLPIPLFGAYHLYCWPVLTVLWALQRAVIDKYLNSVTYTITCWRFYAGSLSVSVWIKNAVASSVWRCQLGFAPTYQV